MKSSGRRDGALVLPFRKRRRRSARKLLNGLYLLDGATMPLVYDDELQQEIARLIRVIGPPQTRESIRHNLRLLARAEVILSGWGAPVMDETFLAAAPKLRAVFYAAGSTRSFVTEAFWKRGIVLTSAAAANAIPTAEYALGAILLSLRQFWRCAVEAKAGRGWGDHTRPLPGSCRRTVGLISLGMVGRLVCERLRAFDVRVIAYDPTRPDGDVELVSLERLFREADVVSVHAPWLPETEGLVTGKLLASMKPGATFINTARGTLVREAELIRVLRQRPDLTAVLDVTHPEPPAKDSELLALPNVVLTPHIAGSHGADIRRLGQCMVEELRRYVTGQPLKWQITQQTAAHRA